MEVVTMNNSEELNIGLEGSSNIAKPLDAFTGGGTTLRSVLPSMSPTVERSDTMKTGDPVYRENEEQAQIQGMLGQVLNQAKPEVHDREKENEEDTDDSEEGGQTSDQPQSTSEAASEVAKIFEDDDDYNEEDDGNKSVNSESSAEAGYIDVLCTRQQEKMQQRNQPLLRGCRSMASMSREKAARLLKADESQNASFSLVSSSPVQSRPVATPAPGLAGQLGLPSHADMIAQYQKRFSSNNLNRSVSMSAYSVPTSSSTSGGGNATFDVPKPAIRGLPSHGDMLKMYRERTAANKSFEISPHSNRTARTVVSTDEEPTSPVYMVTEKPVLTQQNVLSEWKRQQQDDSEAEDEEHGEEPSSLVSYVQAGFVYGEDAETVQRSSLRKAHASSPALFSRNCSDGVTRSDHGVPRKMMGSFRDQFKQTPSQRSLQGSRFLAESTSKRSARGKMLPPGVTVNRGARNPAMMQKLMASKGVKQQTVASTLRNSALSKVMHQMEQDKLNAVEQAKAEMMAAARAALEGGGENAQERLMMAAAKAALLGQSLTEDRAQEEQDTFEDMELRRRGGHRKGNRKTSSLSRSRKTSLGSMSMSHLDEYARKPHRSSRRYKGSSSRSSLSSVSGSSDGSESFNEPRRSSRKERLSKRVQNFEQMEGIEEDLSSTRRRSPYHDSESSALQAPTSPKQSRSRASGRSEVQSSFQRTPSLQNFIEDNQRLGVKSEHYPRRNRNRKSKLDRSFHSDDGTRTTTTTPTVASSYVSDDASSYYSRASMGCDSSVNTNDSEEFLSRGSRRSSSSRKNKNKKIQFQEQDEDYHHRSYSGVHRDSVRSTGSSSSRQSGRSEKKKIRKNRKSSHRLKSHASAPAFRRARSDYGTAGANAGW